MSQWDMVSRELELWDESLTPARLWLRDDDAIEATDALEQLGQMTEPFLVSVTIAVIPEFASDTLATWIGKTERFSVSLHGHAHINHAPADEKKCELGLHRDEQIVLEELAAGRIKLEQMFADRFNNMLVPPWNRIDPQLIPALSNIGLESLSTFGWDTFPEANGLAQLNTHVDIIDWKGSRGGRSLTDLTTELASALATARLNGGAPVGVLSHHLVHDEAAWEFLRQLFLFCNEHKKIIWCQSACLVATSIQ